MTSFSKLGEPNVAACKILHQRYVGPYGAAGKARQKQDKLGSVWLLHIYCFPTILDEHDIYKTLTILNLLAANKTNQVILLVWLVLLLLPYCLIWLDYLRLEQKKTNPICERVGRGPITIIT